MANTIPQSMTRTTMQAANALTGNGTAVAQTAKTDLIYIGASAGTAGIFTFERSHDDGTTWVTQSVTRLSDGVSITATSAAENDDCYLVAVQDGDIQLRARISTTWVTASPAVTHIALN